MTYEEAKTLSNNIAEQLAQIRKEQGISLYRLAELTGLSREGIRLIESGTNSPTLPSLFLICEALAISLKNLLHSEE